MDTQKCFLSSKKSLSTYQRIYSLTGHDRKRADEGRAEGVPICSSLHRNTATEPENAELLLLHLVFAL